jgi:hypothetical protein
MEMIALAFIAGFLFAALSYLLVRGAKTPPCPGAEILTQGSLDFTELFANRRGTGHCINCGLPIDPRCACERGRKLRDATDWDVAIAAESREVEDGRVRYEFLGQTGIEED